MTFDLKIVVVLLPSAADLLTPRMTHWCFLYIDVMLSVLTSPVRKVRGEGELRCLIGEDGFPQFSQRVFAAATSDAVS